MDNTELKYFITALVDGELVSEDKIAEAKSLIASRPEFKQEYEILLFTKSLVQKKCKFHSIPDKAKQKIIRKIKPVENQIPKSFQFLKHIFSKPAVAVSGALALVLIASIIILKQSPKPEINDLAIEQVGSNNMFVQAASNFDNILYGKLTPQLMTDNPENVRNFFSANGVKYATLIPQIKNWNILGAVVSEGYGEKFAHHVYANAEGKLVYLYQVDTSYVNKCEAVKLSNHLMEYIAKGNCYIYTSADCITLMKKMDNNICAIVSNASQSEIENIFCSN